MSTAAVVVVSAAAGLVVGANVGLLLSRVIGAWGKQSEDERVAEALIMGRAEGRMDALDLSRCAECQNPGPDCARVYRARGEEALRA